MHNVVLALVAAAAVARPDPVTIIRHANIVDVEAGRLIVDRDVVVRNDRIEAILDPAKSPVGDDLVEVDATGLYLMPGLFDAHTHLSADPQTFPPLLIAHGVVAARDLGAATEQAIALRESFRTGSALGPELFVTGAIIDGVPPVWPFSEACDTPEQARDAVRRLKAAGVDMVKVYSMLKKDVYEAAVAEAHKQGLKATGHIPESVTLSEAMATGQDCLEHLMRVDAAIAALAGHEEERDRPRERMMSGWGMIDQVPQEKLDALAASIKASGMVQCPTLIVMASIGRADQESALTDPMMAYVSPTMVDFWTGPGYKQWAPAALKTVPPMQKMVAALHKAGATMMIGTDLANPFVMAGLAVHQEMALWQSAGVPAADVLRSATIVPATFCGASDRLGTVAEGKHASMILVRANPLEDVRNARQIEHVFLRGRHLDQSAIEAMLADVKETVASSAPAPEAAGEVELALPGDVIAKGRLVTKYAPPGAPVDQAFDAGDELFLITRSDDGFRIMSHSRPKGGGQVPTVTKVHAGADGRVLGATWKQLSAKPVEASYIVEDGRIAASSGGGSEPKAMQVTTIKEGGVFAPPSSVADFLTLRELGLKPGETRAFASYSFGFPTWQVVETPATLTRHDDVTIDAGGKQVTCSRYTGVSTTPMGKFETETWVDADGVPVKMALKMPFGTVSMARE